MKNYTELKGWTYLMGPCWWTGEDALWARKAKDGAWWVLRFTNLAEAGGKDFMDTPYECEVKRLDPKELPDEEVKRALNSCSFAINETGEIVNTYDGTIVCDKQHAEKAILECCISYGLGAPMDTEEGKCWLHVRGRARKSAEEMMRDAAKVEEALNRPVNAIGSTAREYGNGDIHSALSRVLQLPKPGNFFISQNSEEDRCEYENVQT